MNNRFCISIAAIGSGYLIGKWGHIDKYIKTGSFLMIFSSFCITLISSNTPYLTEFFIYIFYGFTVGLIFQNCIMVAQQVSPPEYLAISTTLISFFNTIGGVVGVAIQGALIQTLYPSCYKNHYPDSKPVTVNDIHSVKDGNVIYVEAMRKTYLYTIVPASVILFICSIFIQNYRLQSTSKSISTDDITLTIDDQNSTEIIKVN